MIKRDTDRSTSATPPTWIAATTLALAIGVVYGRSLDVPFIFDDQIAIVENESIVSLWPLVGTPTRPGPLSPPHDLPTSARPLVNLSFAFNYYLGGLNPVGYHLFNAVIHWFSALLLWAILQRTLRLPYFAGRFASSAYWLALAVAMLWALHPLVTEAVIYATQRTELMMAFFYLATLYCSLRYWCTLPLPPGEDRGEGVLRKAKNHTRRSLWLTLAILASLCGMASKEVMVSAPLMVLLFERTFVAGSLKITLRRSWTLYAGLACTWLLLVAMIVGTPRGQSAGFSLGIPTPVWWLTQSKVLLMYLKLAVWPWPLLIHYELPYLNTVADAWRYLVPVLLLGLATLVLVWRDHPVGYVGTWVFAVLSPTLVVPVPTELAAERRMYLPLAALVALFVVGGYVWVQAWLNRSTAARQRSIHSTSLHPATFVIAVVLFLACAVTAGKRLADYRDEIRLWQQVLKHQSDNYLAHYSLGILYNHAGRESESFSELQLAVAANPHFPNARSALGFALINAGQLPDAVESLQAALAIEPDHVAALNNLGIALTEMGRYSDAIEHLQHALRVAPSHAQAHANLGRALLNSGQPSQAIQHLQTALSLAPDDPDIVSDLATALASENRLPEAIELLERAVTLRPDFAAAHNNLGIALYRSGDVPRAIEHFQATLRLQPDLLPVYINLAESLAFTRRTEAAIQIARRGIEVANSLGDQAAARQLEEWLSHHQIGMEKSPQPN